jgi:hypothetical protein
MPAEEKENRFFLGFVILIVCGLLAALFWVKNIGDNVVPGKSTIAPGDEAKLGGSRLEEVPVLSDTKIAESDPAKRYGIELHYPTLSLAQRPDLAKDANAVIATFASDTVSAFKKDVDELYSPLVPKDMTSDLNVRWSALMLSPTIVSIRFDESEYIAGSAHPNSQTRILNYDLERHLLLQTKDLFASSSQALPFLSSYTREKLRSILSDQPKELFDQQALPGTEPTMENFSVVGITKSGMLVVFTPYQVAPYARGTIQIPIPLSDLGGIISERARSAIDMASTNIVEASPEESPGTTTKMEY